MAKPLDGVIKKHRDGFGFLVLDDKEADDVYLPRSELVHVMDGDRIRVSLKRRGNRTSGQLLEILERRRTMVMGTYRSRGKAEFVEPRDDALDPVVVLSTPKPGPKNGDLVKMRLTVWPTPQEPAAGEILEIIQNPDDPLNEVLAIAYGAGISDAFPDEVLTEAEALPERPSIADFAARRDLRNLPLVTIDGADAKDFDDAVFAERIPGGGFRLVVAIADVAHYVREGSALDLEAESRATSVYFPNLVLPMLPEKLSNGLCSLVPEEERLCMVAELTINKHGKTTNTEIYDGVMRSHARLTYDDVATMMGELEGEVEKRHHWWHENHLEDAWALAKVLNKQRMERGTIDLDLPEPGFELDEAHQPIRVIKRPRNQAHRLIEEFMLAANEAVAYFFAAKGLPTIYRVHDEPDASALADFAALARAHGFTMKPGSDIDEQSLQRFLAELQGKPEARALNYMMLRAMQQAVYAADNIGHFGLAASHYLHFTSPIRRYPDLIVHRLLKLHQARAGRIPKDKQRQRELAALGELAAACSSRERAAMSAEREADDFFQCLYMKDKVGETFEATITSVAEMGVFVELDVHHVDGLVRAEHLGHKWEFEAKRLRLVYGDGRSFGIGDRMKVDCVSVNIARRQVDFEPTDRAEALAEARRESKPGSLGDAVARRARQQKGGRKSSGRGKSSRSRGSSSSQGTSASRGKSAGKAGGRSGGKSGGKAKPKTTRTRRKR